MGTASGRPVLELLGFGVRDRDYFWQACAGALRVWGCSWVETTSGRPVLELLGFGAILGMPVAPF
jgi:hypothetical protein